MDGDGMGIPYFERGLASNLHRHYLLQPDTNQEDIARVTNSLRSLLPTFALRIADEGYLLDDASMMEFIHDHRE